MKENIKIAKELVKVAVSIIDKGKAEFDKYYSNEIDWLKRNGFRKCTYAHSSYVLKFGNFNMNVYLPWDTNNEFYAHCEFASLGGCDASAASLQKAVHEAIGKMSEKVESDGQKVEKDYADALKQFNEKLAPYKEALKLLKNLKNKVQ